MSTPFLSVFLSGCIYSKFGKWILELFLNSLSVDHVSVTEIILKEIYDLMGLKEDYEASQGLNSYPWY